MNTASLDEKVRQARAHNFTLPKEVTSEKVWLRDGVFAYVFRHNSLGELGRLVIMPHPGGQSQFVCEVSGDPEDPMTPKRQAILEPITRALIGIMESVCGQGSGEAQPYIPKKSNHLIKSEVMPCNQCGAPTAMLIVAPNAITAGQLEDHARLMYSKVKELNIPTWVVGEEKEISINGDFAGQALVMKLWPKRLKAKVMLSTELNAELDELIEKHCISQC